MMKYSAPVGEPVMTKLDPELLSPLTPPRCPHCLARTKIIDAKAGPEGFEHRTFKCSLCGETQERVVACDPMRDAVGWMESSELKPPR
jgi:hypothetical protein